MNYSVPKFSLALLLILVFCFNYPCIIFFFLGTSCAFCHFIYYLHCSFLVFLKQRKNTTEYSTINTDGAFKFCCISGSGSNCFLNCSGQFSCFTLFVYSLDRASVIFPAILYSFHKYSKAPEEQRRINLYFLQLSVEAFLLNSLIVA